MEGYVKNEENRFILICVFVTIFLIAASLIIIGIRG